MICDETKDANARGERNQQTFVAHTTWMETISRDIAALVSEKQENELLSLDRKSLQWNIKTFDVVTQMQQILRSIPPQIERQQPVIFEDAHGRITPVHIEFINSFEAFQSVLVTRFQHMPGLRKVRNLEYSMQDGRSQEILDLSKSWESNFRPGRRLNMSMVFRILSEVTSSCPGCSKENFNLLGHGDADVQWYVNVLLLLAPIKQTYEHCSNRIIHDSDNPECRILYRCIKEDDDPRLSKRERTNFSRSPENRAQYRKEDDNTDEAGSEEIHEFRRVQIVFKGFIGSEDAFLRYKSMLILNDCKLRLQQERLERLEEMCRSLLVMTGLNNGTAGLQEPIYSFPSWSSLMQPTISLRTSTFHPAAPDWKIHTKRD